MEFVNEYVSEEDIKKYNINEIWLSHHPEYKRKGRTSSNSPYNWTIDREREVWLMRVAAGGYERGNLSTWVLYWRGELIEIELAKPGEGSKSYKEQPYRIVWGFSPFSLHPSDHPDWQEILQALKEALTVYGDRGVREQAPGTTVVSFKF